MINERIRALNSVIDRAKGNLFTIFCCCHALFMHRAECSLKSAVPEAPSKYCRILYRECSLFVDSGVECTLRKDAHFSQQLNQFMRLEPRILCIVTMVRGKKMSTCMGASGSEALT
jgi:hypothetical protein